MYAIMSNGKVIALCEKPRYVKLNEESGAYIEAEKEDATALAVSGTLYNLKDSDAVEGAPEAVAVEVETGEYIMQTRQEIAGVNETTAIAFVTMAEAGSIDDVTAGEHADLFADWATDVNYTEGQIRKYGGQLYKCVQAHKSQADWTPDAAESLWSKIADPTEEWPEWSQPVGAHDAYPNGAKVSHNGKHWTSTVDANVWEPGVYGWTEETATEHEQGEKG